MNLQLTLQMNSAHIVASSQAWAGDRHYLDVIVSMSRPQAERAICALLDQLGPTKSLDLLRTDYPEFFNDQKEAA